MPRRTPPPPSPNELREEDKTPVFVVCPRCRGERTIVVTCWLSDNRYASGNEVCPVCVGVGRVTEKIARDWRNPSMFPPPMPTGPAGVV